MIDAGGRDGRRYVVVGAGTSGPARRCAPGAVPRWAPISPISGEGNTMRRPITIAARCGGGDLWAMVHTPRRPARGRLLHSAVLAATLVAVTVGGPLITTSRQSARWYAPNSRRLSASRPTSGQSPLMDPPTSRCATTDRRGRGRGYDVTSVTATARPRALAHDQPRHRRLRPDRRGAAQRPRRLAPAPPDPVTRTGRAGRHGATFGQ
jgi:hypothetical protein